MTITAISRNGIPIRLTDERWAHITEEHSELAGLRMEVVQTIENPERILHGNDGEMLALREIETGKFIVVVFREFEDDGFIITAFVTRRRASLDRRIQIWP
jgi:hypothetical protein